MRVRSGSVAIFLVARHCRRCLLYRPAGVTVDAYTQFLARFEVWNVLGRQGYRGTGFGISPHAPGAKMQRKAAEAANFDALSTGQAIGHVLEHRFHGELDVPIRQLRLLLRDALDEFRFSHGT